LTIAPNASTVELAWTPAAGAASYVIEVGSASGLSDIAHLKTHAATVLTASHVVSGRYFARVRAKNLCGIGAPSNEVSVVVQ
jgi:predicted nicotinamide N-methyase